MCQGTRFPATYLQLPLCQRRGVQAGVVRGVAEALGGPPRIPAARLHILDCLRPVLQVALGVQPLVAVGQCGGFLVGVVPRPRVRPRVRVGGGHHLTAGTERQSRPYCLGVRVWVLVG